MKVDGKFVARLRRERGWSQDQLAEVANLGLRTIQRLESDGQCSLETRNSLGAAFGVRGVELESSPEREIARIKIRRMVTAVRCSLLFAVFWGWSYMGYRYYIDELEAWEFKLIVLLIPICAMPVSLACGHLARYLREKHGIAKEPATGWSAWFIP